MNAWELPAGRLAITDAKRTWTCCSICNRNRLCTPVPLYDTRILYLCAICHIPRSGPSPCPVCDSQDGRTLCDGCKLDICLSCGYPCACGDRDGA